jgi:hypothetical protein
MMAVPLEQIVLFEPTETVAAWKMLSIIVSLTTVQGED